MSAEWEGRGEKRARVGSRSLAPDPVPMPPALMPGAVAEMEALPFEFAFAFAFGFKGDGL